MACLQTLQARLLHPGKDRFETKQKSNKSLNLRTGEGTEQYRPFGAEVLERRTGLRDHLREDRSPFDGTC